MLDVGSGSGEHLEDSGHHGILNALTAQAGGYVDLCLKGRRRRDEW